MKPYRLIWFHHFEKAAGTSVVQLARQNGEVFFPKESNGDPRDDNNNLINLWDYTPAELLDFVQYCEMKNVTFVCTSFGAPNFATLSMDPRVVLVTTLRDPLRRLVSHFRYDYFRGGPYRNIEDFGASGKATMYSFHKLDNYYCRILSEDWLCDKLNNDKYPIAKKNLLLFDAFGIVERANWIKHFCDRLDWKPCDLNANSSDISIKKLFRLFKSQRFDLLARLFIYPPLEPDPHTLAELENCNLMDRRLYDWASTIYEKRH